MFGCKSETPPNNDNLISILNSPSFKVIITCCQGSITGKTFCHNEIISFYDDTIKFQTEDKEFVKYLQKSKRDSLYKYFHHLIGLHQPKKRIGKEGSGCLYTDFNYKFNNDSIEVTIKPGSENNIYYKIQELLNLNLYQTIINGHKYVHQLDSVDLLLIKNQNITKILKLNSKIDGTEAIVGLHFITAHQNKSFSIIPSPNPGFSFKQLSPITIFQSLNEFSDMEVLPDRQMQSVSDADSILNKIIGLDVLEIEFEFKPGSKVLDKSKDDIYGINSMDKYVMKISFENNKHLVIDNTGLSLNISH